MKKTRLQLTIAALGATAVLAAGCGGSDSADTASGGSGSDVATKSGGTLTGYYTSFPDFLDPALSYTQEGWTALWTVYTPLLTYAHEEGAGGAELKPGLAEAMPTISDDGLTYKLKLRDGLTYSDGSAVKASDFEHTIKRVLNLESGGSSFYQGIEGATEYLKAGKSGGDISGITTDDATGDITIKLTEADGQFNFYLAMDFAGLVPGDTKFDNATSNPPPGVGPFEFANVKAGRAFSLVKSKTFKGLPDVPVAKADRIDMTVVKNQRREAQDVLNNKVDFLQDPPPPDQLRELRTAAKDRYKEYVTNSQYYYFLNLREKPFDNEQVRQAVATAIDKRALARIFGGLLAPSCNFLPPGMAGYTKVDPCPWGDPLAAPDIAKAKTMIKEAGAEGQEVKVWGNDEDPSAPVTEYLADVLNQIGLKAKPRIVEASVYFSTIGNQSTKAQAGFANWFQDFPSPANFLFLVDGKSIQSTNNQNFGNVDDPEINTLIAAANKETDVASAAKKYAAVDRKLVEKAYVIPYGNRKLTKITSERIAFDAALFHPVYALDLTTLALKAK
jgi:peptide/nickel transport system substrate-binding protein